MLSEEKFWDIIEKSDCGKELADQIGSFTDDELIGFNYWWDYFSHKLYRQDLWAAAYIVRGGCSDDSFDYFRSWLITQGRKTVYNALENADSLCEVFEKLDSSEEPVNEEANVLIYDEIESRSAQNEEFLRKRKEYEHPAYTYDIEFEWEEDDEDSIRAVCPRIFDRFWDSPPFLNIPAKNFGTSSRKPGGFLAKLIGLFTGRR